jgi:ferric-dicitrate binding protein FerR (iron transport regulator)
MNPDHPRYAQWDAAYVVGALSPADRREFEDHLDECADCRRAVSDLAPTAGLLSRLSAEDAERIDDETIPDLEAPAAVLSLARARVRRRRRTRLIALVAAAVLIIAAVAVPVSIASLQRPTESFALANVVDTSLSADVQLTSVAWGTRVELNCRYPVDPDSEAPEEGWTYALAVVGADGTASTISTWRSKPGTTARLSAATALDVGDIRSVEIRTASGTVLMAYDLAQG